jgi:hypothetical protein
MVPYRPLTRIQKVVESLGLSITYAYDDLIFIEHNAFVLQMGEKGELVEVYLNNELDKPVHSEMIRKVTEAGAKEELIITHKGYYSLEEAQGENVQIKFYPINTTDPVTT